MARTPIVEPPVDAETLAESPPDAGQSDALALNYPSWRTLARWLLVALALYGVAWLLWNAGSALAPFIIGLVLAYLFSPIVNRLARKMPRWLAILTVYVGGIVLLVISIAYIVPPVVNQVGRLINNTPNLTQLQEIGSDLIARYERAVPESIRAQIDPGINSALASLRSNLTSYIESVGQFALSQVLRVVNTITFLVGFLIIPIWLFYVLNDQKEGADFLNNLLHPRIRADFWNVWNMINRVFSDYIRGQLILGLVVGGMVGIGLFILDLIPGFDIDYILLLAIVAGITELIPIIGPVIGAIPGVLLAFLSPQGGLTLGLAVLVLYIIVQQAENNFLVPRIVGESVGVHPAILTVVLIAMGQVFGLLGVILSAPIAAIARDLFIYIYHRLGGESPSEALEVVQTRAQGPEQKKRAISGDQKPKQASA